MMNPRRTTTLFVAALWLGLTTAYADNKPAALDKPVPLDVQDLRAIQQQVKKVLTKAIPCTVAVRIGNSFGSGVVVSKDGHVLTAGHISAEADRPVTLIFADGRRVKGKTLGSNQDIDSGMIQITEEGEWPFVEMGKSSDVNKGDWCITLGHPDGYKPGRSPVLRLGRVLDVRKRTIRTSCPLVGGDSGGPLFDMDGKVIGIHSRIGNSLSFNIHVPVDTYRSTWDRLVKGDVWGGPSGPYIGVVLNPEAKECVIADVEKDSPADKAGLKPDDVVLRFGKNKVEDLEDLIGMIRKRKPGEAVSLEVRRGGEVLTKKVIIGKRVVDE